MLYKIELKGWIDEHLRKLSSGKRTAKIVDGIYQCHHFNFDKELESWKYNISNLVHVEELGLEKPYGICDSISQFLTKFKDKLEKSETKYIVSLNVIDKKEQPQEKGWRWEPWGPYIGTQKPTEDYLYNEPEIERVCCFLILEIVTDVIDKETEVDIQTIKSNPVIENIKKEMEDKIPEPPIKKQKPSVPIKKVERIKKNKVKNDIIILN